MISITALMWRVRETTIAHCIQGALEFGVGEAGVENGIADDVMQIYRQQEGVMNPLSLTHSIYYFFVLVLIFGDGAVFAAGIVTALELFRSWAML